MAEENNNSDKSKGPQEPIGMAVSGGGFRATLFHLGSFWRLNELGYLSKLTRICSVSGGSLTNGFIGLKWNSLNFVNGVAVNFEEEVVRPLTKFCSKTVDLPAALGGWFSLTKHPGSKLAEKYEDLFQGATLQDLPGEKGTPWFIIYATNLQSGVSFRLSRYFMGDYKIGRIYQPRLPLATAVAASCAFPPVFTPIILKTDPSQWAETDYSDLYKHEKLRQEVYLSDGGVYDNLGLEAVWRRYNTVLVSDAGSPFKVVMNPRWLRLSQIKKILRVLSITVNQTRALRKRWLIDDFINDNARSGTYWGISTDIDDYLPKDGPEKLVPMVNDNDTTRKLQFVRTRLNRFNEREQGLLINWGYALTDMAMRRHVLTEDVGPGSWPIEKYRLDR